MMKAFLKKIFSIMISFFCTISIVSASKFTTQDGITYMHIKNLINPIENMRDLVAISIPKKMDINHINYTILNDNPFDLYRILGIGDLNSKVNFKINGITYMPIHNLISPSNEYMHVVITNIENKDSKKTIEDMVEAFKSKHITPPTFTYNKYQYKVIGVDIDILDDKQ